MGKVKWNEEEIVSFLEQKILNNTATEEEMEMYEDMLWNNTYKLDRRNYCHVYIKLVKQMNRLYNK